MDAIYELKGDAVVKLRKFVKRYTSFLDCGMVYQISRARAHQNRQLIIKKNGGSIIDKKLKKRIREYSRARFGSSSYWPWLAVYTELRGKFIEGWIPNDYYRFELLEKLNPEKLIPVSEIKSFDYSIFRNLIVAPLFIRVNNQFLSTDGSLLKDEKLKKILRDFDGEIVIKPDSGRRGDGIVFVHSSELNLSQLPKGENLVFQPVVKQHPALNKLNPNSVNTFRVLTHLKIDGEIDVKFVTLKFGVGKSRVDNISSGGGYLPILDNGAFYENAFDSNNKIIRDRHPDTGTRFSEIELSFYKEIIDLCKKAHSKFPYIGIIGWDVFVDEAGLPFLLEWNANNPAFWRFEAILGPMWPNFEL